MNIKHSFIIYFFVCLILIGLSGCSYKNNDEALIVAKKFHDLVKKEKYRDAYKLHIKNVDKKDKRILRLKDRYISLKVFTKEIKYISIYFKKPIKKFTESNFKDLRNLKLIEIYLTDNSDAHIKLYVKKTGKGGWRILAERVGPIK